MGFKNELPGNYTRLTPDWYAAMENCMAEDREALVENRAAIEQLSRRRYVEGVDDLEETIASLTETLDDEISKNSTQHTRIQELEADNEALRELEGAVRGGWKYNIAAATVWDMRAQAIQGDTKISYMDLLKKRTYEALSKWFRDKEA